MKIFIMDKEKLTRYNLPLKIEETFSISYKSSNYKEEILITLEAREDKWYLKSNGSVNVFNNNYEVDGVFAKKYDSYNLKPFYSEEFITIFFLPITNENTYKLSYNQLNSIKIGKNKQCNIIYNDQKIADLHAEIKQINNIWYILSNNNCDTYLNNKNIKNEKLKVGDVIFINGLKITWMGQFLKINNPRNLITVVGLTNYNELINNEVKIQDVSEAEKNKDLYKESDYFYHTPRIKEVITEKEIAIDAPPENQKRENLPLVFRIGSSLTMVGSSMIMIYTITSNLSKGTYSIMSQLPQMFMCVSMIIASLVLPRFLERYQKKQEEKKEKKRQTKYKEYLKKKEEEIVLTIKQQTQIINNNVLSVDDCINIVNSKNKNFWSRQIPDEDFISVRVGIGSIKPQIKINAPEEHFSLEVDNLLKEVYDLKEKYKKINDIPISLSLLDKRISSFIFNGKLNFDYIYRIILQLVTLQSSNDLKIVVFTNHENEYKWNFIKFLPHCWSSDKQQRFFATNKSEYKDVSNYLIDELKKRTGDSNEKSESEEESNGKSVNANETYKKFSTYYLIINDNYYEGKNIQIINEILKKDVNYGFSITFFETSIKNLPSKCNTFVEVGENDGAILEKNLTADSQIMFKIENKKDLDMDDLSKKIANTAIESKGGQAVLPQSLSFLEMYGVSKIDQLNILTRWKQNNPVKSLSAPIGVHANRELFNLDLHEKFHGPHGLIAGSTGSGKSEFIITYILSMAVNYHPYEIQFVLIDYKGGGLAGAFENKETGVKIPHLAGTITNLDVSDMNRTLVSIESELKRRQKKFNDVRDSLGEGTIDIYKYQKLYREGLVKEPMAHLFIISDEFAELKKSQPEFMDQLISTARIGRSLGVHLILATQKPSGVVNDQIWSNSKFKVCLKVQDRSDSMEMLKRPEAASIKETGRFYLQVGYDDLFDIGQSGWAGAKYIPSDKITHKVDDSIDFVDNVGSVIKSIKDIAKTDINIKDEGEQLTNIVKYIYNLGTKEKIETKKLWLDKIPSNIYITNLKQKYNYKAKPYFIDPIIGEYDNPHEQLQGLLNLNLTDSGNTLIYGQPGSGKENLITTIVLSSVMEHTPDEVNFYILDFGSGMLKMFKNVPHVGEIVSLEDEEKIIDTFSMLFDEYDYRKTLFEDYSGSYTDYCTNSGNKLPLIVAVINNYDVFCESYSKLSESVSNIYRDGSKYGIIFVVSVISTSSMRTRLAQNFPNKICLKLPTESDYRSLLNSPKGLVPANIFGRGIIGMNNTGYEFQTAEFVDKKNLVNTVREYSKKMNDAYTSRAKKIPSIPKVVTLNEMLSKITSLHQTPIGYNINTKNITTFDFFEKSFVPIITNNIDDDKMSFIYSLLIILKNHPNTNICIVDLVDAYEKTIEGIVVFKNNFDDAFTKIYNNVNATQNSKVNNFYIILGVGQLQEKLSSNGKQIMDKLFMNLDTITNNYFIGVDTYSSYNNLQVETWYQSNIDKSTGIWLGEDIANQLAINISNIPLDDRKIMFRYMLFAIRKGKYEIVKHVVEEGETDEEQSSS